ncbi:MAG: hypothetical protein R3E79_14550 [Caldilineaceae bacterium]
MLYIPTIVPVVATVFVWGWLLNPDKGLVNATLQWLGLPTYSWLSEPTTALPTLIILSVWGIGGTMVIFLAGLQGVPESSTKRDAWMGPMRRGFSGTLRCPKLRRPFFSCSLPV